MAFWPLEKTLPRQHGNKRSWIVIHRIHLVLGIYDDRLVEFRGHYPRIEGFKMSRGYFLRSSGFVARRQ